LELDDKTDSSSWTTNICIAEFFAGGDRAKGYGYVFSYTAQPDEVVIDTRLLKPDILTELTQTGANQSEILLDKRKRIVKVEMLIINGGYVTNIK